MLSFTINQTTVIASILYNYTEIMCDTSYIQSKTIEKQLNLGVSEKGRITIKYQLNGCRENITLWSTPSIL